MSSSSQRIRRSRKWPYVLGSAAVVVVLAYFIVSSSFFVKAFILPKVAAALGSDLAVDDVSVSPFSQVRLRKVKLTPKGAETLATIEELRVRYSLFAIIGGTIKVREITVESPQITVIEKADGTSNLDVLLKGLQQSDQRPAARGEVPKIDITNVSLKNGLFRQTRELRDGQRETAEINGLNLTLDRLQNGGSGKLTVGSGIAVAQVAGTLAAKLSGTLDIALTPRLEPANLSGTVSFDISEAGGAFKDFDKLSTVLETDVSAKEVKQLRVSFRQAGQQLGFLRVSGPFDLEKNEARFAYELSPLDRRVLGLAVAGHGIDLGQTTISASGRVDVTQLGQIISSNGRLQVKDLSLKLTNGVTPVVQAAVDYQVSVQPGESTALIQRLDVTTTQQGRELIRAGLDRPMNLAWGRASQGFRESTFSLAVTNLNLAEWRALSGDPTTSGLVGARLSVLSERDGHLLRFNLGGDVRDLSVRLGTNTLDRAGLSFEANGTMEDVDPVKGSFHAASVERYLVRFQRGGKNLVTLTGLANYSPADRSLSGQANAEIELPAMLQAVPVEGLAAASGRVKLTGQYAQRSQSTNLSATVSLDGFTGTLGEMKFQGYQATVQATADVTRDIVTIQRAAFNAQTGFATGGSLDFEGKYDLAHKTGRFTFKTVNFNESALGPFVASALQPNRLRSVSLDLNGTATYDANGESSLKSDLKISKLLVDDPAGQLPKSPLGATVSLDGALKGATIELRKLMIGLGATPRAGNELLATGRFDFATNNPAPSRLSIKSDGLDLTTLYNLFMGATNATSAAQTPVPAADPNAEPAPMILPLARLDADLNIAKLFLREVAVSNCVGKLTMNHGTVTVNPIQLTLNGAPVKATVVANVGVPGYTYDLTLTGDQIPIVPLAKSFLTGPQMDLHGRLSAKVSVKGAGVTGRSLRQHLAANVDFATTNLDYQVTAVKSPIMKTLVGVLSTVLKVPQLDKSPIEGISLKAVAAQGLVTLSESRISSRAFVAEIKGTAQLADILTNSAIKLPVSLSITTDGKSQKLPDFLTIVGTVGHTRADIDYLGLAKVSKQLPWGIGSTIGEGLNKAGGLLEKATGGLLPNFGNLITNGKTDAPSTADPAAPKSAAAAPGSTNAPAKTNKLGAILQGLQNAIGGRSATNQTATNQTTTITTNKAAGTNKPPAKAAQPAQPAPKK